MNAENRIRELAQSYLANDHQSDGVRFIDELLLIAADAGEIRCSMAGNDALRFEVENQPVWEMQLSRAKSKLRYLCARLAVLCTEKGSLDGTLYGGAGIIPGNSTTSESMDPNEWKVRLSNTASDQNFCIVPGAKINRRQGRIDADGKWADSIALPANAATTADN
ncbi:MAG TPA: hypothetical protein VE988_19400 [Gemmataceae bacterium]|nr:hypothetical protein [Gemmataceae bacterium]